MDMDVCSDVDCMSDNDGPSGLHLFRDLPTVFYLDESTGSAAHRPDNSCRIANYCVTLPGYMPAYGDNVHRESSRAID